MEKEQNEISYEDQALVDQLDDVRNILGLDKKGGKIDDN